MPRRLVVSIAAASVVVVAAGVVGFAVFGGDDHGRRPDLVVSRPEQQTSAAGSLEWSQDGTRLYVVDGAGIDVLSGSPLAFTDRIEFARNQIATWSGDRSMVALWSSETGVELRNVESGEALVALDAGGLSTAPAWSPDGGAIAIAGSGADRDVVTFDSRTGDEIDRFDVFEGGIEVVAVVWPTPDRIVVASFNSVIAIDPATGESAWQHVARPQNLIVGSATADAVVEGEGRVFALDDGTELGKVAVVSYVKALDWSPDGAWLMASGDDDRPQLWEVVSASTRDEYPSLQPYGAGVSWSPDSRYVAIPDLYDQRIVIVDVPTDAVGEELSIAEDVVFADSAWSPSGDRLAAIGGGHTVFVWTVAG